MVDIEEYVDDLRKNLLDLTTIPTELEAPVIEADYAIDAITNCTILVWRLCKKEIANDLMISDCANRYNYYLDKLQSKVDTYVFNQTLHYLKVKIEDVKKYAKQAEVYEICHNIKQFETIDKYTVFMK